MARIHLELWNADTNASEWLDFSAEEVNSLMDLGIIDEDTLGYAMKDQQAFDGAFECLSAGLITWADLVIEYLKRTTQDLWIR